MEAFKIEEVTAAVRDALARGAIGFDESAKSCSTAANGEAVSVAGIERARAVL
jgi:hypothetical protein